MLFVQLYSLCLACHASLAVQGMAEKMLSVSLSPRQDSSVCADSEMLS